MDDERFIDASGIFSFNKTIESFCNPSLEVGVVENGVMVWKVSKDWLHIGDKPKFQGKQYMFGRRSFIPILTSGPTYPSNSY